MFWREGDEKEMTAKDGNKRKVKVSRKEEERGRKRREEEKGGA